ncbi:MAG TPA: hypothetical protein VFW07_07715 [Parafilimonas sp.]|nr:hypothetical protein [Parafilimonas sp.]
MVRIHTTLQPSLSAVAEMGAKIFEKMESNSTIIPIFRDYGKVTA